MRIYQKMMRSAVAAVPERMEEALFRASGGDQVAFADIVREHQAMVFSLARHFLHDRALAEDLAQDVFLDLFRNLGSIQSAEHLLFWLRKVTCHRCIDQARRRAGRLLIDVGRAHEPAAVSAPPDPLLVRSLRRFLAELPAQPRLIVTLRYQEDLDPADIAEVLDMRVNTVKSHLRRSLAALRTRFGSRLARNGEPDEPR